MKIYKKRIGRVLPILILSLTSLVCAVYANAYSNNAVGLSSQSPDESEFMNQEAVMRRVSVASDGTEGNDASWFPSISDDGRYIAFSSEADNLVVGDTNNMSDVFVHDSISGVTERVSVAGDGTQAEGIWGSEWPFISPNGRYVVFQSDATNLVAGDTNESPDIFVHDRQTGATERVSITSSGEQVIGHSGSPSISEDGRFVVFHSLSNSLVSGDDNERTDVFVHDRQTGQTDIVSVASDGTLGNQDSSLFQRPYISASGRYVAFTSEANNLVTGDTNNYEDVFVHDLQTGITERVSVASNGEQADHRSHFPALSGEGRYVAFGSEAGNLSPLVTLAGQNVYVHDRITGQTELVSIASNGTHGIGGSDGPAISADGRFVSFMSSVDYLVPNDTNEEADIFVHDRLSKLTSRISVADDGTQANNYSFNYPPISGDGTFVAFRSMASNMVSGDNNSASDIFYLRFLNSISGKISLTDGSPVTGVVVSAGNNLTATSGSEGIYSLSSLSPGTYLLKPHKLGFAFSPATREISVPSDGVNQDFTAYPITYSFLPAINKNFCGNAYQDDFSDPSSGWPIDEDNEVLYAYTNGEYRIVSKIPDQSVAASPDYREENFTVQAQVRNSSSIYGTYGIMFNIAADWSHFYTFEIDPDGYYGIWRYSDAQGWDLLYVNYSIDIRTGQTPNALRVWRNGAQISVGVNGMHLATINDSSFVGKDYLGLVVSSFDQGNLDVRFDNFSVTPANCEGITASSSLSTDNGRLAGSRLKFQKNSKDLH